MTRTSREDMVVINMGIDALLDCVRHTETWWRMHGDTTALRRTQQLEDAIRATRRKFFADGSNEDAAHLFPAAVVQPV